MDDDCIISLYFERSEEAIAETRKKYGKLVKSLARRFLASREDAEECVGDTYLALWNSIPPNCPISLSAYLAKIARNLAFSRLNYLNRAKRHSQMALSFDELDDCICALCDMEATINENLLKENIIAFLQTQSEQTQNIFIRRYFFFDSIQEISQRYALRQSAVKMSLQRTRNKLKEYLVKEELYYDR